MKVRLEIKDLAVVWRCHMIGPGLVKQACEMVMVVKHKNPHATVQVEESFGIEG